MERGLSLIKIIIAIFLLLIVIGSVYEELDNNQISNYTNGNEINIIKDKPGKFSPKDYKND